MDHAAWHEDIYDWILWSLKTTTFDGNPGVDFTLLAVFDSYSHEQDFLLQNLIMAEKTGKYRLEIQQVRATSSLSPYKMDILSKKALLM